MTSRSTSAGGDKRSKVKKNEIWSSAELLGGIGRENEIQIPDISNDPRERPSVDVQYKQNLRTEDVFLGVSLILDLS